MNTIWSTTQKLISLTRTNERSDKTSAWLHLSIIWNIIVVSNLRVYQRSRARSNVNLIPPSIISKSFVKVLFIWNGEQLAIAEQKKSYDIKGFLQLSCSKHDDYKGKSNLCFHFHLKTHLFQMICPELKHFSYWGRIKVMLFGELVLLPTIGPDVVAM